MSSEQCVTIDREELARLRADSAELARVREPVEIDMPYTLVNVPDSNETRVIGFRISKSDEAYGEMGLSEPLAWFRKWVGQIASSKGHRIPEGFALVPVEPKYRNPCVCKECGSKDLSWLTNNVTYSGVQNGRLKTSEVTCLFVLGCNECSATVEMRKADWFADRENSMLAAAPKGDSHE